VAEVEYCFYYNKRISC